MTMSKQGILIDPVTRTIEYVDVADDYKAIYPLIDASCFTVAPVIRDNEYTEDGIFVDDNGLCSVGKAVWESDLYPEPLVGKGLILGNDAEGNSITPTIDLETVRASVRWTNMVTIA